MTETAFVQPVAEKDRILSLDAMRGLAILGILAVNVVAFAFPMGVYMNMDLAPAAAGPNGDVWAWVSATFFRQKFITLFSLLFGASVYLLGGERRDPERSPLIRRRLLWLILIGMIHGLLLWWGDILMLYGVTGLVVLLCRSWSARRLITVGLSITLFLALLGGGAAIAMGFAPPEIQAQAAEQQAGMGGNAEAVAASIAAYRAGWPGGFLENAAAWAQLQSLSVVIFIIPTLGLMLLGMGLLKSGFLAGRAPAWVYGLFVALGAGVLGATAWAGWRETVRGAPVMTGLEDALHAFAFVVTLCYMSMMILAATRGPRVVAKVFAPAGRMAFTNYLTQSIIMSTLFTQPWGPRLIGQVTWEALALIVAGIWVLQLIWSPLWLSVFRMGPLEWVWRCLTYQRWTPLRRAPAKTTFG